MLQRMARLGVSLLVVLLVGCGEDKPSDEVVKKAVIGDLIWAGQYLDFKNINRLNGYAKDPNQYVVDVAYDIEFLVDQNVFEKAQSNHLEKTLAEQGLSKIQIKLRLVSDALDSAFLSLGGAQKAQKGDVINHKKTLVFVKSEAGWIELKDS